MRLTWLLFGLVLFGLVFYANAAKRNQDEETTLTNNNEAGVNDEDKQGKEYLTLLYCSIYY